MFQMTAPRPVVQYFALSSHLGLDPMFQVETTRDIDSLLEDTQQWNSLSRGVPFRETPWLGNWWRTFGHDRVAHLLVARDDSGTIRGLLPLYVPARASSDSTLAAIGEGEACTDYISVLAAEPDAIAVAEAFGRHLVATAGDSQYGWSLLDLDGVVEGDNVMQALVDTVSRAGAAVHAQSRMSTWVRPVERSWEDHLKTHGKTRRRKMRRWSDKYGEGKEMECVIAETHSHADLLLDRLIEMHQRRWNEVGEDGSYADHEFCLFIRDAAHELLDAGQLYLKALRHNGKLISAELNIIGANRILYSYSSGFDLDHAEVEPGRVLNVDTLQHLYRMNLAGIDFMRGDEKYKQNLSTESRRVLRLRIVAPSWLPKLRHAMWRTQFSLRQLARRHSGRQLIDVMNSVSS